jgi:thiamine biosynthesis lipoprotein
VLSACTKTPRAFQLWEGQALGAPGQVKLFGLSKPRAEILFQDMQEELVRLGSVFSLYDPGSEISRLNANGRIESPSTDLVSLIETSKTISDITKGVFDISVQPLWVLAQQQLQSGTPFDPDDSAWLRARSLVDYRNIHTSQEAVWFSKPDMAITLNGIAQGYISEKIATMLQPDASSGLVNLGEFQAFGDQSFDIGIQNPANVLELVASLPLQNAGLATSSADGGVFGQALSHIFAPHAPGQAPAFRSASVVHASASIADGLSTAFTLIQEADIRNIAHAMNVQKVLLVPHIGKPIQF